MLVRTAALQLFITLTAGLLLTAACAPQQPIAPEATVTSTVAPAATATPARPTSTAAPRVSPTPAVNITVASPAAGTTIANPVRITGKARVFEAMLMVAVKDGRGNVLGQMPVMASMGAPEWGDYTAELRWDASAATTTEGTIEAFAHSPKDGAVIDLSTVNVTLPVRPAASPTAGASPVATPGATRTASPGPTPGVTRTASPSPTRSP